MPSILSTVETAELAKPKSVPQKIWAHKKKIFATAAIAFICYQCWRILKWHQLKDHYLDVFIRKTVSLDEKIKAGNALADFTNKSYFVGNKPYVANLIKDHSEFFPNWQFSQDMITKTVHFRRKS